MKDKLMKLKLNRKISKLQSQMKKQEKQIVIILDQLEQMESKGKKVMIKKG